VSSDASPSLWFADGRLRLLWRQAGSGRLNLLESTDGVQFTDRLTLAETSDVPPALASLNGDVLLAWVGQEAARRLNLLFGADLAAEDGKDTYEQAAHAGPALLPFQGRLVLAWTGNEAGAHLNLAGITRVPSLGDAIVKLGPDLTLADWFSPWNTQALNAADTDLGSGGILLLPDTCLLVGGGKEGKLYVLDRQGLGHFCQHCGDPTGDTQIVQWFQATGRPRNGVAPPPPPMQFHHIHGSPVYWRSVGGGARIHVWGEADWLRAFRFAGPGFAPDPVDISAVTTPANSMPGAMLSISADGDQDGTGIIWATHPILQDANHDVVDGVMRAIDAQHLDRVLWESTTRPADALGRVAKFTPPTVANGKVYVATFSNRICAYGLLA
jgi:hypothetical protein